MMQKEGINETMINRLQSLYHDFYLLLKEYLEPRFYLKLMNTSKTYFAEIKKSTVIYCFSPALTNQFFQDKSFRERVLLSVYQLYRQIRFRPGSSVLSLQSSSSFRIITEDLSVIHAEHLSNIYKNLDLYSLSSLYVSNFSLSSLWSTFTTQAEIFSALEEISLFSIPTTIDCRLLTNCKKLFICDCTGVTDVSPLGTVCNLIITDCPNITDISALINNISLSIGGCTGVKTFSTFRNVKYLHLHPPNIPSVQCLEQIPCPSINIFAYNYSTGWNIANPKRKSLKFVQNLNFSTASSISFLSSVFSVSLERCQSLTDISCLNRVPYIRFCSCPALTSLNGLNSNFNRRVILQNCSRIHVFNAIDGCEEVEIDRCNGFKNPQELQHVKKLKIICCPIPSEVPCLGNVYSLRLVECNSLTSVRGLSNVPIIEIRSCPILNLHLLECNEKIILSEEMIDGRNTVCFEETYNREYDLSSVTFLRKFH